MKDSALSGIFVMGKVLRLYKDQMPEENILLKTVKCIWVSYVLSFMKLYLTKIARTVHFKSITIELLSSNKNLYCFLYVVKLLDPNQSNGRRSVVQLYFPNNTALTKCC